MSRVGIILAYLLVLMNSLIVCWVQSGAEHFTRFFSPFVNEIPAVLCLYYYH
jgi:hypothetical protein